MINPTFYDKTKAVAVYLKGKAPHYLRRNKTVILESYPYVLKEHEDMYSLAAKVFEPAQMNLWSIIADNNYPKFPDEWLTGETVILPSVILNDPQNRSANYESVTPKSTTVQY